MALLLSLQERFPDTLDTPTSTVVLSVSRDRSFPRGPLPVHHGHVENRRRRCRWLSVWVIGSAGTLLIRRFPSIDRQTNRACRIRCIRPTTAGHRPRPHDPVQGRIVHDETGCRGLASATAILQLRKRHPQVVYERSSPFIIEILSERKNSVISRLQIERDPFHESMIVIRSRIELRHVTPFPCTTIC